MAYTSAWERLSEALARVREVAGLSIDQAKADICRAVSDRAVEIRGELGKYATRQVFSRGTIVQGNELQVPMPLKPEDLDWDASRPLKSWVVRGGAVSPVGHWYLDWIELHKTGVDLLCEPEVGGTSAQRAQKKDGRRSRPAFDRARRAVATLFPDGVPPQADLPNWILCKRVDEWLKKNQLPNVSHDSILRAAGRRK